MAATVFGTAHVYGVQGTITNATVVSFSLDSEHANKSETVNESGNVIERRYDDLTQTGTITIRIRSGYTVPSPADEINYNTVTYEITKVGRQEEAQGFVTVTLDIKKSANISYA